MDYSASFTTPAAADNAARTITDELEHWWSTRIERRANGFTTRFNNSHATFEFELDNTALAFSWTCTDAHMIMEDVPDAAEWVGTRLIWQITPTETGCAVQLTHQGLGPSLPCYDICTRGWAHFFETSLRDHLNGKSGAPNTI